MRICKIPQQNEMYVQTKSLNRCQILVCMLPCTYVRIPGKSCLVVMYVSSFHPCVRGGNPLLISAHEQIMIFSNAFFSCKKDIFKKVSRVCRSTESTDPDIFLVLFYLIIFMGK